MSRLWPELGHCQNNAENARGTVCFRMEAAQREPSYYVIVTDREAASNVSSGIIIENDMKDIGDPYVWVLLVEGRPVNDATSRMSPHAWHHTLTATS